MKRIWRMVLEEPYRVFFPLGMLAGIWGVLMWPMFYAGWLKFYPGEAHTRMMIGGFMGAFVLGFLGTAFPRLAGNRSATGCPGVADSADFQRNTGLCAESGSA